MTKTFLKILFLFLPVISFSQKNLIEYAVFDDVSFKAFKELNISSYTRTWYEENKRGKFYRTDKTIYTLKSNDVIFKRYLTKKDIPYKGTIPECFGQDSLGNIFPCNFERDCLGTNRSSDSVVYNENRKIIKEINKNPGYTFTQEYEYSGDTLKSELWYERASGSEVRKRGELKEYIYKNGKITGYLVTAKYYNESKPPELHVFEVIENKNAVKESLYINNKLEVYYITEYGN